jgi:hypothetical protein
MSARKWGAPMRWLAVLFGVLALTALLAVPRPARACPA